MLVSKACKAVPDDTGKLVRINLPPTRGLNKFQRPASGGGRLDVRGTSKAICMGSPLSIPLNCTGMVDFGDVTIGTANIVQIECQALIHITKINGVAQYLNPLPITLQGNKISRAAFFSLSPPEVDIGGIIFEVLVRQPNLIYPLSFRTSPCLP